MPDKRRELLDIATNDSKYAFEAYEFLHQALAFTQQRLNRVADESNQSAPPPHVSGQELLLGIRDFAKDQFGMMAATVFRIWGITQTDDFGAMVYRLIDAGVWKRSDSDSIDDFHALFDFDEAFVHNFKMELDTP